MNSYNMNQYQQNQVNTASPEQILLMLYDGAIRFTRRAISGIEENKPELKLSGVAKAMAIIAEFSNSLKALMSESSPNLILSRLKSAPASFRVGERRPVTGGFLDGEFACERMVGYGKVPSVLVREGLSK